ncbi:MAG: MBL fold metallo-hydrolase [Deltaproteobacteria bacterium]|nr:MBL fold metallo-hydrolase [Deltaproteobacteria bacterium]MBW2300552.1 MBL fold metallo-hydrolase [Deltaproteobacteria bacterium]
MKIRKPGKVRDGLWYLGRKESCIYLLQGQGESMVISGGMSYICPAVVEQLREFGIDMGTIKKFLILHSHFDHVGVVPFFKRRLPEMKIYASKRAWEILSMPKAIATINEFSRKVAERMGMADVYSKYDLDWRDDISGIAVSEGDKIDLGGLEVRVAETSGHSSCSISAYVPQMKALFPSDAMGIPFKHTIVTSGNSNFTKFQHNLEKLKGFEVEYLCLDHYGCVTGDEAGKFMAQCIQAAKAHRKKMEKVYSRTKDIGKAAKEMTETFFSENPDYFLSPEIFEGVYRQMVRHIAAAMSAG